ncbi:MAG: D-alanyl-D-alanine carboxypeptidase/D-alanyl-D-alanine-endopeptidase [Phycisphaerae bacterium]
MSRVDYITPDRAARAARRPVLALAARGKCTGSKPPVAPHRGYQAAYDRLIAAFITAVALFAVAVPLPAEDTPAGPDSPAAAAVRERLTKLLAQLPKGTAVGLVVTDCEEGTTWFASQPQLPLKPASVMKLLVTAAALERFGPDFTYETRLYTRKGELLVVGSGDPGLGDERIARRHGEPLHGELDEWARRLTERGVSVLKGIALDDTIFDRQHRHPDWPRDQAQAWYQAPVGGINFNDNCLDAYCTVAGGRVNLSLQPDLPASFFRNTLKVSAKHAPVAGRPLDQDVFEFRGPVSHSDQFQPISAARPTVFFGYALQRALEKRGVAAPGQVVRREITTTALADADLLDVRATRLPDVLWRANTFSQNLFAECLLKSLAAYNADGTRSGAPGGWEAGVRVLEATLRELGLDLERAIFRDGSGLSHENRVTAQQVVQVLLIMRGHPHGDVFIQSLAQPGEEGTMRRRYGSLVLRDRLRGKTGTISGVRALAGYVERPDGATLAFALLVNGGAPPSLPAQIAEVLVEAGVETQP